MNNFQNILKSLRKSQGLTQDELSKRLQISRSAIGMYEKGSREPDFETLELIADFFDVTIDYLVGRTSISSNTALLDQIACAYGEAVRNHLKNFSELSVSNQSKVTAYTNGLLSTQQMEEELLAK